MKACVEIEGIALLIPTFDTGWRWVIRFTPRPLCPDGKCYQYLLKLMLVWSQNRPGLFADEKSPQRLPGFEPWCFRCPTRRLVSIVCEVRSNRRKKAQDCELVASSAYCTDLLWLIDVWYWALSVIRHSWKWGRCVDCVLLKASSLKASCSIKADSAADFPNRKQNVTHTLCSLLSAIIKIAELRSRYLEKKTTTTITVNLDWRHAADC